MRELRYQASSTACQELKLFNSRGTRLGRLKKYVTGVDSVELVLTNTLTTAAVSCLSIVICAACTIGFLASRRVLSGDCREKRVGTICLVEWILVPF